MKQQSLCWQKIFLCLNMAQIWHNQILTFRLNLVTYWNNELMIDAEVAELGDAADSKSAKGDTLWGFNSLLRQIFPKPHSIGLFTPLAGKIAMQFFPVTPLGKISLLELTSNNFLLCLLLASTLCELRHTS